MRTIRYQEIADDLRDAIARGVGAGRCCRARASCRPSSASAGSPCAGRWRRCATSGWSSRARASGGSSPPSPCSSGSSGCGTIERSSRRGASQPQRRDHRVRVRRRPPTCRRELGVDQRAARQARQPRRRRAVRRRHRVVPGRARPAPVDARRRAHARSTSCSASRCAARRRRSAPTAPSRPTPSCSAVPAGTPVLRCERVTTDTSGRPILLSEHIFPAHRTEFVVDLPMSAVVDADRFASRRQRLIGGYELPTARRRERHHYDDQQDRGDHAADPSRRDRPAVGPVHARLGVHLALGGVALRPCERAEEAADHETQNAEHEHGRARRVLPRQFHPTRRTSCRSVVAAAEPVVAVVVVVVERRSRPDV